MRILRVTVESVMSWEPCEDYPEELVRKLFGRKKYLTARQILDLDIPAQDRLWPVLRPKLLPEKLLHEFACDIAEYALKQEREAGREPDERSWEVVRIKRLWIHGEASDEELDAARDAAWAARDAARAAAWDAAWAAWDAAWAAAWDKFLSMLLAKMDEAGVS